MENEQKPRIRLNAKQTAKGDYQLDVTVETFGIETPDVLAGRYLAILKEFTRQMVESGNNIVGGVGGGI